MGGVGRVHEGVDSLVVDVRVREVQRLQVHQVLALREELEALAVDRAEVLRQVNFLDFLRVHAVAHLDERLDRDLAVAHIQLLQPLPPLLRFGVFRQQEVIKEVVVDDFDLLALLLFLLLILPGNQEHALEEPAMNALLSIFARSLPVLRHCLPQRTRELILP